MTTKAQNKLERNIKLDLTKLKKKKTFKYQSTLSRK